MREIETASGRKTVVSMEELGNRDQPCIEQLVQIAVVRKGTDTHDVKYARYFGTEEGKAKFRIVPIGPELKFATNEEVILSRENYASLAM